MNDAQTIGFTALIVITCSNCLFALLMIACGMPLYIGLPMSAVIVAAIIWVTKRKLVGKAKMWRAPKQGESNG